MQQKNTKHCTIDHSIRQLDFLNHTVFFIVQYISKVMGLEALCRPIFQPCVSSLLSHIDFTPEAKLFWHCILQPRTTVKECESLFRSMMFFLFKNNNNNLTLDGGMWSESLVFKDGEIYKNIIVDMTGLHILKSYRIQSWQK